MSGEERTAEDQFLADVDIPDAQRRAREQMARAATREADEAAKRDAALDALAQHRASAVALARGVALGLAEKHGRVTSVEVLRELRTLGHGAILDQIDARFVGVVFREGWERIGYEPTGSHKRPVSVWRRVEVRS